MEDEPVTLRNYYSHCESRWEDDWSCACNDQCPICGTKDIEPYHSEELSQLAESWEEIYRPIHNHFSEDDEDDDDASGICQMFETFGPEYEYVLAFHKDENSKHRVWTLVEGENTTAIVPGLHFVNRLGYFVTEIPFDPSDEPDPFLWNVEPPDNPGDQDA